MVDMVRLICSARAYGWQGSQEMNNHAVYYSSLSHLEHGI